jgi:excisionase family DNA binding protein
MSPESFITKLDTIIRLLREQTLMQKQVFNSHEAALYLNCSLRHIYRMSSQSKIPCYKVDGRRLFFSHPELQQWLLAVKKSSLSARKPAKGKALAKKSKKSK